MVTVGVGLAMIVPVPASVGVFEAAALLALNAYGISNTGALPYALVLHVVNFLPFVILGGLALHFNAIHLRRAARTRAPGRESNGGPPPSARVRRSHTA